MAMTNWFCYRLFAYVLAVGIIGAMATGAAAKTRVHGIVFADLSKTAIGRETEKPDVGSVFTGGPLDTRDIAKLRALARQLTRLEERSGQLPRPQRISPGDDPFLRSNILLPDIKLALLDAVSGALASETISNVNGVFDFPGVPKGRYRLCWEGKGWEQGCLKDLVSASDGPAYVLPVRVAPQRQNGFRTLAGRVLLADRTPCRFFDHAHGIDITAQVRSVTTPDQNVRANSEGYYVLPFVKTATQQVLAQCRGGDAKQIIRSVKQAVERQSSGQVFFDAPRVTSVLTNASADAVGIATSGPDRLLNLNIANRRPVAIDMNFETAFGQAARAPAGSSVAVVGDVLDAEKLAMFWTVSAGEAEASGTSLKWRAPERRGRYIVTLLAGDGRGGWKRISKAFEVTDDNRLPFSGAITIDRKVPSQSIIPSLDVRVNGERFKVNAEGRFFGKVEPADNNRYVLNIDAPGVVPLSRVFHRDSTGGSYDLKSAAMRTFDASQGAFLRFDRQGRDDLSFVRLFPGTLIVAATGAQATGAVTAELAYLDPGEGELPGDYDAIGLNGEDQALISFGAIYVGLQDAAGRRLQLQKDAEAELSVQIAPNSVKTPSMLPPTVAVWTYNTDTGFWEQESLPAVLVGNTYRTQISHFSTVNMDLGAIGNAACVRVQLDFIRTPEERILRVSTDNGLGGTQTKQVTLDQRLNAVFRLLPLSTVEFEMLHADGTVFNDFQLKDEDLNDIPGNTITLQPGEEMQSLVDLWPDEPFDDCPRLVVASGDIAEPAGGFFTRKSADSINADRAEAYYAFMDPNNDRETLEEWLTHNGFDPQPTGNGGFTFPVAAQVVTLAYLNHGDLGSGRKMHCRKDSSRVACVVGNYAANEDSNFNRDPASADTAQAAESGTGFATVAMEYSPLEGFESEGSFVKFFTFGEDNNRARIIVAALDEAGSVRNHPEVCHMCHGGSFDSNFPTTAVAATNMLQTDPTGVMDQINHFRNVDPSSFREFDLGALRNLQGSQPESKAKQLNCDYVLDSQPYFAIKDLIIAWYGDDDPGAGEDCDGVAPGGENQTASTVPLAWQGSGSDIAIYNNVVARVCRTCHIAQKNLDFTDPNAAGLSWNTAHGTHPYTCNVGVAMPNAPVPFNAYWIDGYHDEMVATYGACP